MTGDSDALGELGDASDVDAVHLVQHYIYFPSESDGKAVAQQLRRAGFDVVDRLGADGANWLVLAKQPMIPTEEAIGELRTFLEAVAAEHGGEYDGWEAEVPDRKRGRS
jgi:Regulator of ribonuclease activity B